MRPHSYIADMMHAHSARIRWLGISAIAFVLPALVPAQQQPQPQAQAQEGQAGDPPARVGRISATVGAVSFQPSGTTDWSNATLNYTVTTGDRLFTGGQHSRAEVEVGTFAARMSDSTDLTITNLTDHLTQLGLAQGTFRMSVYRMAPGDSVEVDTPNGALTLDTPGEYRVEIPSGGNVTMVSVDRGNLEVTGPGVSEVVRGGQAVQLTGTNPVHVVSVMRPGQNAFDQWSADRDRRYATSPCKQYVSGDMPGCADLAENGHWSNDPAYGSVWYPPPMPVGWAPYRYGQWVWVEPWGWTWVEDEPWGFAPFHYGRWAYIGTSWGWIPGPLAVRPYYAPALVAFVGGPGFGIGFGFGVQAWFPLGPREPFFPWYHYGDGYLRSVNYTNVRGIHDINGFVHVANIESVHYVNQSRALTVVPTTAFNSGRSVRTSIVRATPAQVARAEVMTHPSTIPTASAAMGGRPAVQAPAGSRPSMITAAAPGRPTAVRTATVPATRAGSPGLITKAPPPSRGPAVQGRVTGSASAQGSRTLITRAAAPPQNPSFNTRAQAMAQNNGRPLEPQQMQNLRAGRAAGPPRDADYPPRAGAAAAAHAALAKAPARKPPKGSDELNASDSPELFRDQLRAAFDETD